MLNVFVWHLLFAHAVYSNVVIQDLQGSHWKAEGEHPPSTVITKLPYAEVPGCVHTDWLKGKPGIKNNPYYRFNDVNLRSIAESDWKYSTAFKVSTNFLSQAEQWLVFEGVDTFAYISLNDKFVGATKDMFLEYRFNVTGLLQQNFNLLSVSFVSAVTVAHNFSTFSGPIPPNCPPDVQHGFCHVNLIRKEQSSFSWDWGPAFATQGIWKPVYLMALSEATLIQATAAYDPDNSSLDFTLKFQTFTHWGRVVPRGNISITVQELGIFKVFTNVSLPQTTEQYPIVRLRIDVADVNFERWWPNGYGKQKLYDINVAFNSSTLGEKSQAKFKFGFRKVELVQEPIEGAKGLSFYFKINDVPVFAKGANWIPADAFNNRVTMETLRTLMTSARDAHMNMLRIWGGGIYEDSRVYDLADELGIMLWQDFMFACAMYPADQRFLGTVGEEVKYQAMRLQHHPSIVVWAGNNENEAALATNWYNTSSDFSAYKQAYVWLYVDTVGPAVHEVDQLRPYLTSSPTNGVESKSEGWVAKDPYSVFYGDVHYYNYNDDCLDWTKYPKTRFASEYGFQSWPSFETIELVTESGDWTLDSDWSNHRQHHANGNEQMTNQISMHFRLPDAGNATQVFKDTIYLTQVMQALCYKSQTEFYRRSRDELVGGAGHTMGALYWQLNDIWQAPTWSSIEYGGKWKILHFYAQKFFAPVALIAYEDDATLKIYSASDVDYDIRDTLIISVRSWQSHTPYGIFNESVTVPARRSTSLFEKSTGEILHYGNCPYKELCYISVHLKNATSVPATYFFPVPFKSIEGFQKAVVKIYKITQVDPTTFNLTLTSQHPALFVWLQAIGIKGRFSDNGFIMPEQNYNVTFHAWQNNVTAAALCESVTIKSLSDVYEKVEPVSSQPEHDDASVPTSWLDDVTAKLVFAIIGVCFIVVAALQFTCLVLRFNVPTKRRAIKPRLPPNNNYLAAHKASVSSIASSRSGSVFNETEHEEPMAFLIQSKRGYGHMAKKTEIRFYVI